MWIALDACSEANGGLTYIPGSHHGGLFPHQPSWAAGSSQEIRGPLPSGRETPHLDPGDVATHHCLTIHGSAPNLSAHPRRGVTIQYVGESVTYDTAAVAHYERELAQQMEARS